MGSTAFRSELRSAISARANSAVRFVLAPASAGMERSNYGVKIGGLTVPAGVLPAWSATLMPTELDLNLGGANLDLDSLVREAIEAFDLTTGAADRGRGGG